MRGIAVVGSSGSGKSTMAGALAQRLKLGHIELDAHYHLQNWTHPKPSDFRASVEAAMDDCEAQFGGWTLCGDYETQLAGVRERRCDTIVWLDFPRWVVMGRLARRTIRRAVTREALWNGNREPLTNFYSPDPDKNVFVWSWTHFDEKRERFARCETDGTWADKRVHRLQTPLLAREFIDGV